MKIIRKIFFGILIFLICGAIYGTVISESNRIFESNYDPTMQNLNYATAFGSKIAAYDVEADKYTSKYIPEEFLAKKVEEVGYVLKLTYTTTSQLYTGYHRVSGKIIDAQLVKCSTGEVVMQRTFKPYFPYSIKSNVHSVSVPESKVANWVTHLFPEGPGSDHDWQEATCVSPKKCSMCDLTEGSPLPHDWVDGKCSYCLSTKEELGEEAKFEHQVNWFLKEENAGEMYGTCSECGEFFTQETDWDLAGQNILPGRWKASKGGKGTYLDLKNLTDIDVYFQVNRDGTAVIEYEDTRIPLNWSVDEPLFNPDYPTQYQIRYALKREDGSNSFCHYICDGYVDLKIDGYTLYLEPTMDYASFDHTVSKWNLDFENVSQMYGTCSDCGERVSAETDWSIVGPELIPGTYNANMYTVENKDGHSLLVDGELVLEVMEDGTAALTHSGKVYPYTWEFTDYYTAENYPHMFDCYYSFLSKSKKEYDFGYSNNIITLKIDKYTIFFDK